MITRPFIVVYLGMVIGTFGTRLIIDRIWSLALLISVVEAVVMFALWMIVNVVVVVKRRRRWNQFERSIR